MEKKPRRKPPILGLKATKGPKQWYKGRLCPIRKEKAWFLSPNTELPEDYAKDKDVFMHPNYISEFVLPLAEGDLLEFILGDRDKTKPMAQKVRVSQYSPRSCKTLVDYIMKLVHHLNSVDSKKVLVQAMPCTAMWRFLGSPVFKGVSDPEYDSFTYMEELLILLKQILHHGKVYKTLLEDVIKTVTKGTLFQATSEQSLPKILKFSHYDDEDNRFYSETEESFVSADLVRSFCENAIRQVPSATRCLLSTITAISEKIANPSMQSFLCTLLLLNSPGENAFIANASVWMELPMVITNDELSGHLVEKDKHLLPVKSGSSYDDPEQYMDTYFRLVRAETFSAIQKGIKQLKNSQLDLRDMNVFHSIHLAGFELHGGQFLLAIQFTPTKTVKKWEATPQLMYGNIVCISVNRKFDDVIWATVANRDVDMLNKHQIIMLELLDENVKSMSEIIRILQTQGGSAIMVESPTYYHSLSPILRSLKEFDMDIFPLKEEVVYAKPILEIPSYLKEATLETSPVRPIRNTTQERQQKTPEEKQNFTSTLEASDKEEGSEAQKFLGSTNSHESTKSSFLKRMFNILSPKSSTEEKIQQIANTEPVVTETSSPETPESSQMTLEGRMNVERFLESFNSSSESSLEASQCEALVHALKSKLAVIQGPPGCGKTFIGVKIVQLLLSLIPKLDKPILLLTYKNHALDEFLKHMLDFCQIDDLVRIGGRSKEPELESCNLKNLQTKISYNKTTLTEIQDKRNEIDDIETQIKKIAAEVESSSYMTIRSFVSELTEEQLQSFILEAGWGTTPMLHRVNKRSFADKSWITQMLDDVSQNFGSVKEFLLPALERGVSQNNHLGIHCFHIFQRAFHHWFPGREQLQRMKQFQADFILQIQSDKTNDDDASKASNDNEDEDSGDEDYVKQILDSRMASGPPQVGKNDLILFNTTKTKTDILLELSDYPPDMAVNSQIRSVVNLWSLNEGQRLQFLYCVLNEKATNVSQELNNLLDQLQSLKKSKQELEMNDKVELLLTKKIIGVTITGASINHEIIHHIGPSVVIVEEAAEILEPSLLAALTPSIKHLILIGDHKQLRPQVDTYALRKDFDFDISMMERLIGSGFPFKSLTKQNRMRPEFSALLHDIYPNLEDNLPLVTKNKPLKCIEKSMFFWSHEYPEKHDRTYTNEKEAERIKALVLYLLCNGCRPSDITVLAAYLGQTKILRNAMKKMKEKDPHLFKEIDRSGETREGFVQVQTIDMYQGDENKYILVSLVRSNERKRIGFLKEMNRRCVSQSRAKCGMYFVGSSSTLCGPDSSCWTRLITSMINEGCVADEFPLQCTKHEESKYKALDSNSILDVISNPTRLCKQLCGDPFPRCDKHPCKKPCFPRHVHEDCPELVIDRFPVCGHSVKRRCPVHISEMKCQIKSTVDLPCGHEGTKKCHQNLSDIKCKILVEAKLKCGHQAVKECHVNIHTISCKQPCQETNACGEHKCQKICGERHGHDCCPVMVDYKFPKCGHPSSDHKKCFKDVTWNCEYKVTFKGACGHDIEKKCYESESAVKCPFKPCERKRKCGHPCENKCGDDCEKGECKHCQRVFRKKMEEFRAAARARMKEIEELINSKEMPSFSRDEIRKDGSNAAEYQSVIDQVMKFIQPCHKWFPRITRIEKVTNLELEKKFEAAKSRANGDYIDTKFHGTSNEGLKGIIRKGFRMPEAKPRPPKKPGMYGQGIYFATDSSKSAQEIYTKGSQKLLLCQVILGKSMIVHKPDYSLNKKKLKGSGCDSVFAPRGTAVKNDEFVIFDPDQALPQYIIHFSDAGTFVPPSPSSLAVQQFTIKKMSPTRTVDFQDPFEMYYNFAESHFRRMAAKENPPLRATITSIDVVINKDLEDKFNATKQDFKAKGISDNEILAYHGTDSNNVDNILKTNLQLSYARRQAYGKGNYFSEYPSVSLGYGDGLLLCRILPGKEFIDSSNKDIPSGYNSKKVLRRHAASAMATPANASGDMIIIENSDQILPFFVINR